MHATAPHGTPQSSCLPGGWWGGIKNNGFEKLSLEKITLNGHIHVVTEQTPALTANK